MLDECIHKVALNSEIRFGKNDYIEIKDSAQIRLFGNLKFSCDGIAELQRPNIIRMEDESVMNV